MRLTTLPGSFGLIILSISRQLPFALADHRFAGTIFVYSQSSLVSLLYEVDEVSNVIITREDFLEDRQGRTFGDVLKDPEQPFEEVLAFFSDESRQRRMEESELHHDRAPLAGIVRELESVPTIDQFLSGIHAQRTQRFRQAIGVLVRIVMQRRGWKKTGKKGSLGVRASASKSSPSHNTGGLAFWFVRAERYKLVKGMPFQSVTQRSLKMQAARKHEPSK